MVGCLLQVLHGNVPSIVLTLSLGCRVTSRVSSIEIIIGLRILIVIMVPNYYGVPIKSLTLKWDFIAVAVGNLLIRINHFLLIIKSLYLLWLIRMHGYISCALRAHAAHITHIFESRTRLRLLIYAGLNTQLFY